MVSGHDEVRWQNECTWDRAEFGTGNSICGHCLASARKITRLQLRKREKNKNKKHFVTYLCFQQFVQISFHETLHNVHILHLVNVNRANNIPYVDDLLNTMWCHQYMFHKKKHWCLRFCGNLHFHAWSESGFWFLSGYADSRFDAQKEISSWWLL